MVGLWLLGLGLGFRVRVSIYGLELGLGFVVRVSVSVDIL